MQSARKTLHVQLNAEVDWASLSSGGMGYKNNSCRTRDYVKIEKLMRVSLSDCSASENGKSQNDMFRFRG